MKKYNRKHFPYEAIERVVLGDAEAMTALVSHFMPYIKELGYNNQDIEDRMISKLMRAVLKFRLDYEKLP